MNKIQNHGFIAPSEILAEEYIFGSSPMEYNIYQPDGDWSNYLPVTEYQLRNGLETANCTAFGTLNCLETLIKRKYGIEENFSERFLGIAAGTRPPGNSPHVVCDALRDKGIIDDKLLPFGDISTIGEYYSPDPLTADFLYAGKSWLDKWEFTHEWVVYPSTKDKKRELINGLKYSPLGVSVLAWKQDENGLYTKNKGEGDNHWVTLYGYVYGQYFCVFDHYDDTTKKLIWDYDFLYAKRFAINKIQSEIYKKKVGILELLKIYFSDIMK